MKVLESRSKARRTDTRTKSPLLCRDAGCYRTGGRPRMLRLVRRLLLIVPLTLLMAAAQWLPGGGASASAAEAAHHIKRVLFISVDGMHALDVANYVKDHPGSTLAKLRAHGVTYTQAWTSKPSDSFPGTLAEFT